MLLLGKGLYKVFMVFMYLYVYMLVGVCSFRELAALRILRYH